MLHQASSSHWLHVTTTFKSTIISSFSSQQFPTTLIRKLQSLSNSSSQQRFRNKTVTSTTMQCQHLHTSIIITRPQEHSESQILNHRALSPCSPQRVINVLDSNNLEFAMMMKYKPRKHTKQKRKLKRTERRRELESEGKMSRAKRCETIEEGIGIVWWWSPPWRVGRRSWMRAASTSCSWEGRRTWNVNGHFSNPNPLLCHSVS